MLGRGLSTIKMFWRVVFGGGRRVWDAEVEVREKVCVSGVAGMWEVGDELTGVNVRGGLFYFYFWFWAWVG